MYDGLDEYDLEEHFPVARLVLRESVGSTLDLAHELAAAGARDGTLVLANTQTAGRGRIGRSWSSETGAGIWMAIIERPEAENATGVIALRAGIAAAQVLDAFTDQPVSLKWPNDLYLGSGKLAGILVEARWRAGNPEWLALGIGINVLRPENYPTAATLRPGTSRVDVIAALVLPLRKALTAGGDLSPEELDAFQSRDLAAGRKCIKPAEGTVLGITAAGELRVARDGEEVRFRGGSLVLQEEP